MIPDDIQDLHFHIDDFKNGIEKEFAFLKEATCKNIENFQSSLNLQQTYSTSLCLHVNPFPWISIQTIPVKILPQYDQQNEQNIPTEPTHPNLDSAEIPQLEDNSEGEQYQDLETYLSHHNTFEASKHIRRDYRSRLLALDDDKYYQEVDRVFDTYRTPPAQDYIYGKYLKLIILKKQLDLGGGPFKNA